MKLVLRDEIGNGLGVPAGIEEGCFTRDFIPDEVAVHSNAVLGGGNDAKFAPGGQVNGRGQPAASDVLELCRVETD